MEWYKNIWKPRSLVTIIVKIDSKGHVYHAGKVSTSNLEEQPNLQRFDDIEELVNHFGSSKAYALHVIGNGILSRLIESHEGYKDQLIINGNVDEFMFSSYDDGKKMAVSFCRRSLIQKVLDAFSENNWHLYELSCGKPLLLTLLDDEQIAFDFSMARKENCINRFSRAEQPSEKTSWRNQYWKQEELLALALMRHINIPVAEYFTEGDTYCEQGKENYSQFSQFKFYGISVISAILLSLIVNYFYQNHLNQRVAQLEEDLSIHNENLAMLDRLNQEKQRKEQLVMSAGVTSDNFLSFYMNEIGKSVPKSIHLSEMIVFPIAGKLKNKRKIEVSQNQIRIEGITRGNVVLDDWIEAMNRFDWVERVELLNYLKDGEDMAEFELIMTLE
ncbi:MAG: hypothetical protein MK066_09030 [Crocinitomicaceae bacterium]|nr:hypothetical protein [Crocinitomicaceae bacterium]